MYPISLDGYCCFDIGRILTTKSRCHFVGRPVRITKKQLILKVIETGFSRPSLNRLKDAKIIILIETKDTLKVIDNYRKEPRSRDEYK